MPRPESGIHPADERARYRWQDDRVRRTRFNMPAHYNAHSAKPPKQMVYTIPNIADTDPTRPPWSPSNNIKIKRIKAQSSQKGTNVSIEIKSYDKTGELNTILNEFWHNNDDNKTSEWWHPDSYDESLVAKNEWVRIAVTGVDDIEVTLTIQYTEY